MIPVIIEDLKLRENGISGRYSVKCSGCGQVIEIHVDLTEEGHFCYTAKTEKHKDCRLLDSDYFYFYNCNPFPMKIARKYHHKLHKKGDKDV